MIESKDNEKLKLVRKLRDRKHREREGLFATEGEDLLEAGLAAGAEPHFILLAPGAWSSLGAGEPPRSTYVSHELTKDDHGDGELTKDDRGAAELTKGDHGGGAGRFEVEPGLLDSVSSLGSGTRVIAVWSLPAPTTASPAVPESPCVYLDGVGDPGNVGTIVRTADALLGATVALGPGCADAFGPRATRASMGSLFARPPLGVTAVEGTPAPRVALVAHGGEGLDALAGAATLCLGAEREGLPGPVLDACERRVTIPLVGAAESLNVAAAAAIACERLAATGGARISSLAMSPEAADA